MSRWVPSTPNSPSVELLGRNPISEAGGRNPKLIQRAGRARQKAKSFRQREGHQTQRGRESRCMWQELEYICILRSAAPAPCLCPTQLPFLLCLLFVPPSSPANPPGGDGFFLRFQSHGGLTPAPERARKSKLDVVISIACIHAPIHTVPNDTNLAGFRVPLAGIRAPGIHPLPPRILIIGFDTRTNEY